MALLKTSSQTMANECDDMIRSLTRMTWICGDVGEAVPQRNGHVCVCWGRWKWSLGMVLNCLDRQR